MQQWIPTEFGSPAAVSAGTARSAGHRTSEPRCATTTNAQHNKVMENHNLAPLRHSPDWPGPHLVRAPRTSIQGRRAPAAAVHCWIAWLLLAMGCLVITGRALGQ